MEKFKSKPLAIPHNNLEKYNAPNEVVTIITTTATMTRSEARIMEYRRQRWDPIGPVRREPMKAPRIMKDEMICWGVA